MNALARLALVALLGAGSAGAQEVRVVEDELPVEEMTDIDLADYIWVKRPVVVFADSPFDPAFVRQMELLREREDALAERDVVILTDTDPAAQSSLRTTLRPRGFMLVLIGKDGGIKLRKPFPWDVRELTRSIDKMPMRQQELRDDRAAQEPELDD